MLVWRWSGVNKKEHLKQYVFLKQDVFLKPDVTTKRTWGVIHEVVRSLNSNSHRATVYVFHQVSLIVSTSTVVGCKQDIKTVAACSR